MGLDQRRGRLENVKDADSSSKPCSRPWRSRKRYSAQLESVQNQARFRQQHLLLAKHTDEIAKGQNARRDVLGRHFFSPANVMNVRDRARGKAAPDALKSAVAVGAQDRKSAGGWSVCLRTVLSGKSHVAQRGSRRRSGCIEGCSCHAALVDAVVTSLGMRWGSSRWRSCAGLGTIGLALAKPTAASSRRSRMRRAKRPPLRPEDRQGY